METTVEKQFLTEEISKRVKEILELLGEDTSREGLKETPMRVAKALIEMTYGLREDPPEVKVFDLKSDGGSFEKGQLIIGRSIKFSSMCEHHMLPFIGRVDIAYVVGEDSLVAGFSKLSRLVNYYASRPQIQERLVQQIADGLMNSEVKPAGVLVIAEAVHMCVYVRGVKDSEASLTTMATRGVLKTDQSLRNQAIRLMRTGQKPRISI